MRFKKTGIAMIRYDAITPTVGRMVWYFDESQQRRRQPLAALVTYVWNEMCRSASHAMKTGLGRIASGCHIRSAKQKSVVVDTWVRRRSNGQQIRGIRSVRAKVMAALAGTASM